MTAQRIVVVGGPWPERVDCKGIVVPALRNEYPWVGCPKWEVVIKLDDDPLQGPHSRPDWTCVMARSDVMAIDD